MEAEAIVLDTTEHAESDLIVTFYCRKVGRLSAIAKGAKKSKKRFVNKLEIFSFLHITFQRKNQQSLAFLEEAELYASFLKLRQDISLYNIASVIREFLLLGTKEAEPEDQIFALSLWALHQLERSQQPLTTLTFFLIRYFDYLGYRPNLESCGTCGAQVKQGETCSFNTISGQLSCSKCTSQVVGNHKLSPGTIKMLQSAQNQSLERLHRLVASGTLVTESLQLLHAYGVQIFQREIISWKVVQSFTHTRTFSIS